MQGSLVLIETAGNQRFVFATNRLAENLGASQMIWRVGVEFVLEAVKTATGRPIFGPDPAGTRANLRNEHLNPPFAGNPQDIEIVTAASGKALLLVGSREVGKRIVAEVTRRALAETPGVEVRGLVGDCLDLERSDPDQEIKRVHDGLANLRNVVPGADLRFLRLPVVAPCATSGLPASLEDQQHPDFSEGPPDAALRSEAAFRKYQHRAAAHARMRSSVYSDRFQLPQDIEKLLAGSGRAEGHWLAVVHADGNGLGEIFLKFGEKAGAGRDWRKYVKLMRDFSLGLDECTETATRAALEQVQSRRQRSERWESHSPLPAFPLVLGGDDLTLVCDGRLAVRLTRDFLEKFSAETQGSSAVSGVVPKGLTASAGVAIVKPHFPFHLAYQLAEDLLKTAKKHKPESALDFHVHYDASGGDLASIRSRLRLDDGGTRLLCRPYRINGEDWRSLERAVARLQKSTQDDEPVVASSVLHELRAALFLGREAAEKRLQSLLKRRRGDDELGGLLEDLHEGRSLFRKCSGERVNYETGLLDLLEIREFWGMTDRTLFTLRLTMLSNWHVGTGAGRPGDVDRLVARDATSLPFAPAKTVIGIWRDACERLVCGLDEGRNGRWTRWLNPLFGSEPGRPDADPHEAPRPAALSVRPARFAVSIRDRLRLADERLRSTVTFVKPGVMIDPDSGSARHDFLRMEEMARGGVELVADCELDLEGWRPAQQQAAKAILMAAASLIERLGGKRRRGHGRCSARIDGLGELPDALKWIERNPGPPNPPDRPAGAIEAAGTAGAPGEGWSVMPLRLVLKTPVVVPAATVGNVVESLDYVPGSFLLPVLAGRLRRLGIDAEAEIAAANILVLPATIEVGAQRGLPAPMAFFAPKRTDPDTCPLEAVRNCFVEPDDDSLQLQPVREGYISLPEAGELPGYARVNKIVATHGTIDDSAQRPTAAVGGVFSYGAIAADTVLRSEIWLRQSLAERLAATGDWWRDLAGECRLGRSKKDDYGCVEVELPEGGPAPMRSWRLRPGDIHQELKLWLLSDLLVRDAELRPDATLAAVCRALCEALPGVGRIRVPTTPGLVSIEARLRRHDSWQVAWGLARPSLVALQAGSCFRVILEHPAATEALAALEAGGIGERRPEGFGQVRFNDSLLQEKMEGRQPRPPSPADAPEPLQPLSSGSPEHAVAACIERAAWRAAIAERALAIGFDAERRKEVFRFAGDKPGPSQLGALRSRIARMTAPETEDGPLRRWLQGVEEHRKDRWPAQSLDCLRALVASQNAVWDALGPMEIESLTEDAQTRLEKELWPEAIVALIGAAIRGQVIDMRA